MFKEESDEEKRSDVLCKPKEDVRSHCAGGTLSQEDPRRKRHLPGWTAVTGALGHLLWDTCCGTPAEGQLRTCGGTAAVGHLHPRTHRRDAGQTWTSKTRCPRLHFHHLLGSEHPPRLPHRMVPELVCLRRSLVGVEQCHRPRQSKHTSWTDSDISTRTQMKSVMRVAEFTVKHDGKPRGILLLPLRPDDL